MDFLGLNGTSKASKFEDVLSWPSRLQENKDILDAEEKKLVVLLLESQQSHLFESWDPPGIYDEGKHSFFQQIKTLHINYPIAGGLSAYCERARKLLESSKLGENPYDRWTPSVPSGVEFDNPFDDKYTSYEGLGLKEVGACGFVLVAGGLGERLGYSGIKVGLPTEMTTTTCYLHLYCKQILAIQARYAPEGTKLPLAIMVSDDTKAATEELLVTNNYFGMHPCQLTIMKQEKVAALTNNEAHIAMTQNKYEVDAKPHGHGDVHALMHSTMTARSWLQSGIKWVVFFQDTNGLSLCTLPAVLGVSLGLGLEVNSVAVPRKAQQAVGAITKLTHEDGREMTINIEYNQLDPLLRATIAPDGDTNDRTSGTVVDSTLIDQYQ